LLPTHIHDYQLSPSAVVAGVKFFGTASNIDVSKKALLQQLVIDTRSKTFVFDLLKSSNMKLSDILVEANQLLEDLHVTVRADDNTDSWAVILSGLGDNNIRDAEYRLTNFEKRIFAASMRIPLPPSWGYPNEEDDLLPPPKLVLLNAQDPDYKIASDIFFQSGINATISKIERVQNVDLYRMYTRMKQEIARRNNKDANELLLKHGTRNTDPSAVWNSTYGFDFRYSTESNFYGRGSYFTDNTSYVKNYAFRLPTGERQLFIARVAAGKHEERRDTDKTIVKPMAGCHSVRGPISGNIFGVIVYELRQSYPEYLVTFNYHGDNP
jgi:hypothetical protein